MTFLRKRGRNGLELSMLTYVFSSIVVQNTCRNARLETQKLVKTDRSNSPKIFYRGPPPAFAGVCDSTKDTVILPPVSGHQETVQQLQTLHRPMQYLEAPSAQSLVPIYIVLHRSCSAVVLVVSVVLVVPQYKQHAWHIQTIQYQSMTSTDSIQA